MSFQNPADEQVRTMLKNAKRIAVVGLSGNPDRTSYEVSHIMQKHGYEIIPVNPTVDEVLGEKAVSSLKDIEGKVDIVNVFRRSEHLPEVAEEAAQIDADVFWAQLGLSHEDAAQTAVEAGMTVVMDRCIKVEHGKLLQSK
ncbi:hypothetical protein B0H94_103249 [Salsuginibacillus halophilus]|uniref:CoA-binding domain-containing protein n=1 Tax=Salsuginibacillus halophilus TaxID=517424 RepID=A0A2P8HWM0_9BACI|nr:CoA-binding protein [Salsuginibacillus halophilus]PSL50636.1 hypothetical protein B0H94_103249 [Salsuginibacillus halophilus]